MTIAVIVLAHEPAGDDAGAARQRLRDTLDSLWSEEPGADAKLVVHAGRELAVVARREHGRRVDVWPAVEGMGWAETLSALAGAVRQRSLVWLRAGARVTPGWLRELAYALEHEGVMAGPRLPLGTGVGSQSAHVPPGPTRSDLREAATRVRFEEPRLLEVETLAAACVGLGQRSLDRVGRFDGRYAGLSAVLLDLQARLRARGGRLVVARRALVHAAPEPAPSDADARALERRRARLEPAEAPALSVAIELEDDAPERERWIELTNALWARGVAVHTFSRHTRPSARPTAAPHHCASSLAAATHGVALVLVRRPEPADPRARRLALDPARAEPGALVAPAPEPRDDWPWRLDAWAREVEAAARAAVEGGA